MGSAPPVARPVDRDETLDVAALQAEPFGPFASTLPEGASAKAARQRAGRAEA